MGLTRWQWYYNKTQHTQIHTSHSTQSYTNNKGHITHNEDNTKEEKFLQQAVEAYRVFRC
jgi:hypothetical protein